MLISPTSSMTLPSECVSLNRPGFEDLIHPRRRRGGGNVGIGFIDFQGLWEGRKTALSFSGLSINRHFHGLARSAQIFRRRSSPLHPSSLSRTALGLHSAASSAFVFGYTRAARRWFHPWPDGWFQIAVHAAVPLSVNQTESRCTRCPSSFPCGSLKA